jgi:hypothetical protein
MLRRKIPNSLTGYYNGSTAIWRQLERFSAEWTMNEAAKAFPFDGPFGFLISTKSPRPSIFAGTFSRRRNIRRFSTRPLMIF